MKIGGFGHILGDVGSGYAIAHNALRKALKDYERNHLGEERESHSDKSALLNIIMAQMNMTSLVELTGWSLCATKAEMADLATLVLKKWKEGDSVAKEVVEEAVNELAKDVICLVNKLRKGKQAGNKAVQIGFTGSLLSRNEQFASALTNKIKEELIDASFVTIKETVYGGIKLLNKVETTNGNVGTNDAKKDPRDVTNEALQDFTLPIATTLSLTELRNPKSMKLDQMSIADGIDLMISEDEKMFKEIAKNKEQIEIIIKRVSKAFKKGGRLFYCGAGTSGRLGVLDASECPPTFTSPPHWVQGIIAGGDRALRQSIEGAEDVIADGIAAILDKDVNEHDIVIGIAACGRTPFVWGGLYGAKLRNAFTALITMNSNLKYTFQPDAVICVNVGPEVLTGSTRLKSGTATKCVLNMISTLSMVQYGKCMENLMVDVMPNNEKLRDRCLRIVMTIVNDESVSKEQVENSLIRLNYDIRKTVEEIRQMIKLTKESA